MNTKELKITPPKGYEIDRENSSLDHIKFKPIKKKLTYIKDVSYSLFAHKRTWYILDHGDVRLSSELKSGEWAELNNCTSEKQAQKLLAINQLMNTAKYLNGDWNPNWNDSCEDKWYLKIVDDKLLPECNFVCMCGDIYFKSRDIILQAIEILGEDTIKLALSTDW